MVYICNGILFSHEKNEIMPFAATWMDLEIIILILGWPKRSFEFFYNILWKNLNELFGQPNNMIIYISKSE